MMHSAADATIRAGVMEPGRLVMGCRVIFNACVDRG